MYSWLGGVLRCNAFQASATGETLLPPPPMSDDAGDSDWDTSVVAREEMLNIPLERRHSGWEAVEKKWIEKQLPQRRPGGSKLSQSELAKDVRAAMEHFAYPQMSIPTPHVEFDFRMKIVLNSQFASVSVNDGFKKLTTVAEGMFSGHFGHGVVVVSQKPLGIYECVVVQKG